jgi:curli production assembly/transport component CsgE
MRLSFLGWKQTSRFGHETKKLRNDTLKVMLALLLGLIMSMPALAEVELRGLLLNQTRTFAGQAFYKAFVDTWLTLDADNIYSLVITERPSARNGSQMIVKYADQVVYQQFIHFNANRAQKAGQIAPASVYDKVVSADVEEIFVNPDLAKDEIKLN